MFLRIDPNLSGCRVVPNFIAVLKTLMLALTGSSLLSRMHACYNLTPTNTCSFQYPPNFAIPPAFLLNVSLPFQSPMKGSTHLHCCCLNNHPRKFSVTTQLCEVRAFPFPEFHSYGNTKQLYDLPVGHLGLTPVSQKQGLSLTIFVSLASQPGQTPWETSV